MKEPETLEEAKQFARDWHEKSDQALIEANEYNLSRIERKVEVYG